MSGYPRPRNVLPVLVGELIGELGGGTGNVAVTGVTHSSSAVQPGDLYVALPGARVHGAQFIPEALQRGAVAVLTDPAGVRADAGVPFLVVDRPRDVLGEVASKVYGEPTRRLTTIGITGTAGKTSTTYLIEAGLRAAGQVTGLIGTVETRLGDLTVKSIRTTPEATDLHALFAAALERGVQSVAMEVSSHALEVGRVGGVRFAAAGYTNFGLDHLDFHPTVEAYFAAKARLFDGRAAVEILNADDVSVMRLRKPGSWTYSVRMDPVSDGESDFGVSGVTVDGYGQAFDVHWRGRTARSGVQLPGRHNVANALLAIASLVAVGVDLDVAARAVAAAPGSPGRMERVDAPGDVVGVVDYAHKPDAMVEVLKALRTLAASRGGRVICLVGAGGDRDRGKRPLMGRAAAEGADLVIVTDDNPRTEDPAEIRAGVLTGTGGGPAEVVEIGGRREAIAFAVAQAKPGDVIALLGKGHETGQEVNGEVLPFDDRVELAAALREANS
ncbi:UDP-N-acetylmuramoyl-L-alanyl-D-glutamate--2,6-diaminopimelate ligase [Dactylosporangium vinaceum]|uniref:UDP-N-acetylmuramoyl-L-alanyl-D-glutamate--2,6-diaminopimelate ligase n=1 Tax=Dactylosporangium vinaceum TaxID=53362 RepID=A0ABV5MGR0_9ACTN|nr:UDP-N-acetylmuramoyl-L-alanyl-D-glutamate--2,6-diaminopimelate ligase [Dactylosporangium vinaceum]UAB94997.1 UDP-N-acetylmuramoyl-L-alanyl-D-glutamate--2,6-diaminopimelate ligase [Dactylosporangium vinaceum]